MFSIDLVYTKRNTLILKCFLQFACTNLVGSQKKGVNYLNLLQKEGDSLRKRGEVPTLQETIVNHILRIIPISHCVDISYVDISIDAIKTVTLFITYTLCNNFIFIFNQEKVQSYSCNNSFQAGKVNAKL